MMRFEETLHPDWTQSFRVGRVLHQRQTGLQDLAVFENETYGRVLTLDGVIQVTERDEAFYHEMMAHVPLLAHGAAARVLIIGGGDGGVLREVLRHPGVAPTMVEIDSTVVEVSREWLPGLSDGAFDNPRTELLITDGLKYVAETDQRFDVIIVDSTDPEGPGEVLFTEAFYRDCHRILTDRGVLVTQNGVPMVQPREVTASYQRFRAAGFADTGFYLVAVPSYVGGLMTLGWAAKDPALRQTPVATLEERFAPLSLATQYYTPAVHAASFVLPPYIQAMMV